MLRLIPAPLHRLAYRAAHWLRRKWYGLRGGEVLGCSMIARDPQERILLVRHSYGPPLWTFPGGGVGRNEDPHEAAQREFREELGCRVEELEMLGTLTEDYLGATNIVTVFTGTLSGEPMPDGREIIAAQFFERDCLPPVSETVLPRLRLLGHSRQR